MAARAYSSEKHAPLQSAKRKQLTSGPNFFVQRRLCPGPPHVPRPAGGERGSRRLQEALGHKVSGRGRRSARQGTARKPRSLAIGSSRRCAAPRPHGRSKSSGSTAPAWRPPLGRSVTSGAGTASVCSQPARHGRRPSRAASRANRRGASCRAPSRGGPRCGSSGAQLPKVHLSRHCRQHRTAREPQRGAPRAATMVPRTAARTAPSGRRAGVTETARSPRPQSQWARPADSASRHRQEAKVSRQRITKALCCSSTAWSEQKQRDGDSLAPRRGSESELSFTANPSTRGFGRGSSTNQARDLKIQYTR